MSPRIPALREAVAQDDERPFPLLGKVDVDAIRLDDAMRDSAARLSVGLIASDGINGRSFEPSQEFAPSHCDLHGDKSRPWQSGRKASDDPWGMSTLTTITLRQL